MPVDRDVSDSLLRVTSPNLGRGKSDSRFCRFAKEHKRKRNNRDVTPSRLEHNNYRLRFFEHDVSDGGLGRLSGRKRKAKAGETEGNRAQGWKVENVADGANVSCAYTQ